jgi:hypothetical protein
MSEFTTWQDQECVGCGGRVFVALVKLRAKAGGGFTTEPGGYACQKCGEKADVAQMQRVSLRQQRLAELRALEAEMSESQSSQSSQSSQPFPKDGKSLRDGKTLPGLGTTT